MSTPSLSQLRRYAVGRTLFRPTTLPKAIQRLGFVQADPIRAPARAQDLILRHRVSGYRAGDLERRYPRLAIEEDAFVNYGYLPRDLAVLMHPRTARHPWIEEDAERAAQVLEFVRERGTVHPREVEAHFQHGRVTNWFGGSSNASTRLLDGLHYRGRLRVVSRVSGTRTYGVAAHPDAAIDPAEALLRLLEVAARLYSPLPRGTLTQLASHLRYGAPHLLEHRRTAVERLAERFEWARLDGVEYGWPAEEDPRSRRWAARDVARLLAPFDPIVWDRKRFQQFWGWDYKFEAYTPAAKRVRGYYALPLLWRDRIVGWANLAARDGELSAEFGYVDGRPPAESAFAPALADELTRLRDFLRLD